MEDSLPASANRDRRPGPARLASPICRGLFAAPFKAADRGEEFIRHRPPMDRRAAASGRARRRLVGLEAHTALRALGVAKRSEIPRALVAPPARRPKGAGCVSLPPRTRASVTSRRQHDTAAKPLATPSFVGALEPLRLPSAGERPYSSRLDESPARPFADPLVCCKEACSAQPPRPKTWLTNCKLSRNLQ